MAQPRRAQDFAPGEPGGDAKDPNAPMAGVLVLRLAPAGDALPATHVQRPRHAQVRRGLCARPHGKGQEAKERCRTEGGVAAAALGAPPLSSGAPPPSRCRHRSARRDRAAIGACRGGRIGSRRCCCTTVGCAASRAATPRAATPRAATPRAAAPRAAALRAAWCTSYWRATATTATAAATTATATTATASSSRRATATRFR